MEPNWTITELVAAAVAALGDEPVRVNGRVRDLPNERLIRWYTTIGLVDPPSGRRGRTALYGERHLLQLVAVKRRQAAGRTIAEIQAELLGAPDAALRRIARLPAPEAASQGAAPARHAPTPDIRWQHPDTPDAYQHHTDEQGADVPGVRRQDLRASGARGRPASEQDADTPGDYEQGVRALGDRGRDAQRAGARSEEVAEPGAPAAGWRAAGNARGRFWAQAAPMAEADGTPAAPQELPVTQPVPVSGVRLAPGVTLLIDAPALDPADLEAIGRAAEPLLAELRRRGLSPVPRLLDDPASPIDPNGRHP